MKFIEYINSPQKPSMGVLMNVMNNGHIVLAGKYFDDEDVKYRAPLDSDDGSGSGLPRNQLLPSAVNVSHVCREWRN
jgi:hypothetical protein